MSTEGWEPMMRRLVDAELRHYGYTDEQLALANLDRPHTDDCEFDANHQGWVCTDENGKSFHPEWDEATDVSSVIARALEALHYDEEETKALAETATGLGYELGRKEAGEEIARAIEKPRPTVQVGCAHCPAVIEVPFEFTVTNPDDEGHQYLEFDPDMADLWAHSWRHAEEAS